MRRRPTPSALSACVLAAALALACEREPARPPNVVVYVVDTLRDDALAPAAQAGAPTPHFDALAREGTRFTNARANASWTRASIATLLTGLLPWRHGAEARDDRLPEAARTLAELFAEQGYDTALVSANPNVSSPFGFRQAFGRLSELYARKTAGLVGGRELVTTSDVVTRESVEWLRSAREPFLLVALPIDPHFPYDPPARFDPARGRAPAPAADTAPTPAAGAAPTPAAGADGAARARELYQGEVAFNDESFGALIAALRERGQLERTIVVVTSDHGEEFFEYGRGGHGKSLSEQVLRVPLIVRSPGDARLPPGTRSDRPISLVDLAPTLLDLAGLPIPDGLDGHSAFAAAGEASEPALAGLDLDGQRLLAAVDGPWKLVWNLADDSRALYDLREPQPEATPVDVTRDADARAAYERLASALARSLADRSGALPESRAGELPEDVEQSLRALGYLE